MQAARLVEELQAIARQVRRRVIEMTGAAGSGHPGGSLSAADIVVTLYFDTMRHDPARPKWAERDRFMAGCYRNGVSLYDVSYVTWSHRDADVAEALQRFERAAAEL